MQNKWEDCSHIWAATNYLTPDAILEFWCDGDQRCRVAKQHAIMSACEDGLVEFKRADGQDPYSDDEPRDLARRGLLLIERTSFEKYMETIDEPSPLPVTEKMMNKRTEAATDTVIGALLNIILLKTDGDKKRYSTINTQHELINAIDTHFGREGGLSESHLEKKFAAGNKAINSKHVSRK